ncbi:MAG: NADPH2:quinone reductase [Phenylobacterium sp.]|nr:NADPH2:quinone reductase [Phenylobacterium sp.]
MGAIGSAAAEALLLLAALSAGIPAQAEVLASYVVMGPAGAASAHVIVSDVVWPRPRGPGPLNIMSLPKSIKIGYATFFDHIHTPELLRARSAQLFDWITEGKLKVRIGGEYALADAARAHADIESRKTTGKLLLVP